MLRECDASELVEEPDEVVPWLPLLGHNGYIAQGWSHLLAAYTRMGKTELITETMYDWLLQGQRILYFTEEPRGLWKQRMQKRLLERGIIWPRGLQLVFALGVDPRELLYRVKEGQEPIVFVDTIRTLLQPNNENDNSELARLIVPWIGACRDGDKTSVFVHHDRKAAGEHGRGIAGGHALMAACDIAIEITGVEGDTTQRKRNVHAFARVYQPPDLQYDWEEGHIVRVSIAEEPHNQLTAVQTRILNEITDEWQLTSDIMQKLTEKPSGEQLRRALNDLAEQNRIRRDPPMSEDAKGKSVRWTWMKPDVSLPKGNK